MIFSGHTVYGSAAHLMTSTIFLQSVDADGFGVCFEMGKKCRWMLAPSLSALRLKRPLTCLVFKVT